MRGGKTVSIQANRLYERMAGFTLVWVLAAIAILSVGLAAIGPQWADQAQRAREQDLLRVGQLYAQALAHYRAVSPGSLKQYPSDLQQLLLDNRFVGTQRHLRKLYPDPLDPLRPWGLVRGPDGRILGVFSQSADTPLRRESLDLEGLILPTTQRYDEWKFIARPPR
jgi:type II secretory pathway pseudopilin PulG